MKRKGDLEEAARGKGECSDEFLHVTGKTSLWEQQFEQLICHTKLDIKLGKKFLGQIEIKANNSFREKKDIITSLLHPILHLTWFYISGLIQQSEKSKSL